MRFTTRRRLVAVIIVATVAAGCGGKSAVSTATLPTTAKAAATTAGSAGTGAPTTTSASGATTRAASGATTTAASSVLTVKDPCKLVSKADAEKLAGTTLQAGVLVEGDDPSCTYSGDPNGPTAQVEVFLNDGAKKYLDIDRQLSHDFTTLTGIGDEAYLEEFTIFFRKGARWGAIHLVRLLDADPFVEPLKTLAKQVVAQF
jgi:hypothetical protein